MRIDSAPRSDTSPVPEPPVEQTQPTRPAAAPPVEQTQPTAPAAAAPVAHPVVERPVRRPLSSRARLWTLVGIAALTGVFLLSVHSVVRPFIWAGVVAYVLNPVVGVLERRLRLPHGVCVGAVMLTLLGLIVWGITAATPVLKNDLAALNDSLTGIDTYLQTYLANAGTITILGVPVQAAQLVHNIQTSINDLPRLLLHNGLSVAASTIETLLRFLTFLLSTLYLLRDGPRLRSWLSARIPDGMQAETTGLAREINTVLSEYLRAEVILILIMSTASAIALSLLGVRFALLLAPIVGFLEIFPIIGPFFAIAMVAVVALIGPPNYNLSHVGFAIVVALVFFVMRQLEDYLVIPNVVGHAVKLHPVLILFGLLCGATLGGILGMFLAIPVMGTVKVLARYIYDRLTA